MAKLAEDFPHALALTDAGFGTEAKVRNASDEDLLAIEGIGPAALAKIRAAAGTKEVEQKTDEPKSDDPEVRTCSNPMCGHKITESPCPYCGHA